MIDSNKPRLYPYRCPCCEHQVGPLIPQQQLINEIEQVLDVYENGDELKEILRSLYIQLDTARRLPGVRARVKMEIDCYPHVLIPVGTVGTLYRDYEAYDGFIGASFRPDNYFDALEDWENHVDCRIFWQEDEEPEIAEGRFIDTYLEIG